MRQFWSAKPAIRWTDGAVFGAVAILATASLASCFGFDQWVFSALLKSSVDWDANIWVRAFTRLGKGWLQIWLLLVWLLVSHRRRDVLTGLAALVLVGAGVSVLKIAVGRPRPYETVKTQAENHLTSDMSFPSGDMAAAVAVTTAILPALEGPAQYLLAAGCVAIGGLRVAGMAHYPSDVLAGAAIGLVAGWLAKRLVKKRSWFERERPLERWLVWAGIVGIPAGVALSMGLAEMLLILRTYGVLVFSFLLALRIGGTMRAAPERVLSFLTRKQFQALLVIFSVIIVENILVGEKPRELLPFDEQPVNPIAVFGLLSVAMGAGIRLRARSLNTPDGISPSGSRAMIQRRMSLGMFLVVCGLLWQLRDPANWLVALPIFALFYGVPLLGGDWTLSRVFDRQWWLGQVRPFFVRLSRYRPALPRRTQPARWRLHVCTRELCMTLVLLLLPFAIELLIEDLVFEGLLRM